MRLYNLYLLWSTHPWCISVADTKSIDIRGGWLLYYPGDVMVKKTILVIDDDLFWHRLLKRLFCEMEYDVRAAANCEDGVRMAEQYRPACILLDFHLKDGDAVDVCAALKKGGEKPRFPVIVVSSDPDAELTAYAECRADRFVLKGSPAMMELPSIVRTVLDEGNRPLAWETGR